MKKRLINTTISRQIIFYYVILYLMIFFLCGGLYFATTGKLVETSENSTLKYGLQVVESNMDSLIENINDYSKAIAFNSDVQTVLQKDGEIGYEERKRLQNIITQMAASCNSVSSIYLFDNKGGSYVAGNLNDIEAIRTNLEETSLYQSILEEQKGDTSGTVIFSYDTQAGNGQQIITFARRINSLSTLKTIGFLVMVIPSTEIQKTFQSIVNQTGICFEVFDRKGRMIGISDGSEWLETSINNLINTGNSAYQNIKIDGKNYRLNTIKGENDAWGIAGVISRSNTLSAMWQYMAISIILLLIGMAFCIFGAAWITTRITQPLHNILGSMDKIKNGTMERIPVIETSKEMNNLQEHYNQMLDETEELMSQKVEEQRMRRKYELSLLQAQIKPHFLYNTFDSVCALAMMGRTQDVYKMMQALGQYYRESLHKGQEIITVKEELSIVENYLTIQTYRFEDVFKVVYDVDENIKTCRMIKLVLQPLVENAINHGFREHELTGTITIRAKDDGNYVKLQVQDDGIGMDEEKLKQILDTTEGDPNKRFGLSGTIKRINLYYQHENKNLVKIESAIGKGTNVMIWIPKDAEGI